MVDLGVKFDRWFSVRKLARGERSTRGLVWERDWHATRGAPSGANGAPRKPASLLNEKCNFCFVDHDFFKSEVLAIFDYAA